MSSDVVHSRYPSVEHLRQRARKRIPRFALEYLEGGCNSEINLRRNIEEIHEVQLRPWYLRDYPGSNQKTTLFGKDYDAPFGVAPVGLQGLMWPGSTEILAKAA
ncbi:MAG: alpha-hydroxy-acid oxidizing protein, partial [Verrucomicrobiota bacterium]